MGQHLKYLHNGANGGPDQWVNEGSVWRPSSRPPAPDVLTLYDGSTGGVLSSSNIATLTLTLYDLTGGDNEIINNLDAENIKNTRNCTISTQGLLVLIFGITDTVILDHAHAYERRRARIDFTWPMTPTKADTLIIDFVIRNISIPS